ncbi:MAG TPA: DNA-processing protein DprA [Candidatus Saccharimonadales bacterium]|nr:DNA-processing protein DprA [Candidatus Saccharimonadales bacterium]
MKVNTLKLTPSNYPDVLRQISSPPKQLYWRGVPLEEVILKPRVAIVGSRKATPYGRTITEDLATRLARAGVVIISGLAFGIDSYAHKATLAAGGCTIAVLPSPIQKVAPATHHHLAEQIVKNGGALTSEYSEHEDVHVVNFIARNRIVSGLADVLLITEAAKNSGSLHTARFALEQGKTVMAVPGNINSPTSEGCNNLIKSGAVPVTGIEDVFFALGMDLQPKQAIKVFKGTSEQQLIYKLITQGIKDQEELAQSSQMAVPQISSTLTTLELQGYIRPIGAGSWTIA